MIAEKLRMIKSKSVNTTLNISTSLPTEPSPNSNVNVSNVTNPSVQLSPQEISQVTGRLNQIRPQIPQIDKLLLLHSKLPNPPVSSIDLVKKLTEFRNVLVNQIELVQVPDTGKRIKSSSSGYLMGLGQLNVLIEQVQRFFNALVSKMKESAGVVGGGGGGVGGAVKQSSNTVTNLSPTISNTSASSSNSLNSASTTSSRSTLSNSSEGTSSGTLKTKQLKSQVTPNYDKLLLQRLSLPPDGKSLDNNFHDNYTYRNILRRNEDSFHLKPTNQRHLKLRNILLSKELENLKEIYRIKLQDEGLGIINLQISTKTCQFIFKISKKYPYDELIYRIITTPDQQNNTRLPKHLEPKKFPISVTNIIRNYESRSY